MCLETALIIGARGMIGRAFLKTLRLQEKRVVATHHQEIDGFHKLNLAEPNLRGIKKRQYSYAIIAAGAPNLLKCEKEPEMTYACNVLGTCHLVEQLCEKEIVPVVFSTDYVFDGQTGMYTEESLVQPLNEYGRQKAELEGRLAQQMPGQYLLARLSKVYGMETGDGTLLDEMIFRLKSHQKIRAASDQIFSPIFIDDVVDSILRLLAKGLRGVYNVCGNQTVSRLELAKRIYQKIGAPDGLVEPISLRDLGEPFQRPCKTDMVNQKLRQETGIEMKDIGSAIKETVSAYDNK